MNLYLGFDVISGSQVLFSPSRTSSPKNNNKLIYFLDGKNVIVSSVTGL